MLIYFLIISKLIVTKINNGFNRCGENVQFKKYRKFKLMPEHHGLYKVFLYKKLGVFPQ